MPNHRMSEMVRVTNNINKKWTLKGKSFATKSSDYISLKVKIVKVILCLASRGFVSRLDQLSLPGVSFYTNIVYDFIIV